MTDWHLYQQSRRCDRVTRLVSCVDVMGGQYAKHIIILVLVLAYW